jgi:hypothetical protein
VLLALFCLPACLLAQTFEQHLEQEVAKLEEKHGSGTSRELKRRLNAMAKRDQAVRTPTYVTGNVSEVLVRRQQQTDDRLTRELKQIVARDGWPTIRLVGLEASENAALVLVHSRDHDFQRSLLRRLQTLVEQGEILGSSVALLTDKILISEGKPQRFGTQFDWTNKTIRMLPVEDQAHLDERRAKYLLPPMAEYTKTLQQLYGRNEK